MIRIPALLFALITLLVLPLFSQDHARPEGTYAITEPDESPTASGSKIGLALSGGAALGFAHIGVLLELEEAGVPVQCVAGTSMGSVVGALYAAGYTADEIFELAKKTNWNELFTDSIPRRGLNYEERRADLSYLVNIGIESGELLLRSGVSAGQNIVERLDQLLRGYAVAGSFDRFPRPLRVVATDLVTGEEVIFEGGDLKSTVRASMAVPGFFSPLEYRDRLLIDGGWVNVLPVEAVREMGADYVIAVNARSMQMKDELDSMPEVLQQSSLILRRPRLQENIAAADLVIAPDVSDYSPASFEQVEELVAEGRRAARRAIEELEALASSAQPAAEKEKPPSPQSDLGIRITRIDYANAKAPEEQRRALAENLLGETKVSAVQKEVYGLYRSGRYEYVSYELLPRREGLALIIDLQPRHQDRATLRGGYSFRSEPFSGTGPKLQLQSNLTVRGITGEGSRWSTDVRIADISSISTEYVHQVFRPVSFLASLYALSEPMRHYHEDRVQAYYLRRRYGAGLGIRRQLFGSMELTAAGVAEWIDFSLREGTDLGLETDAGEVGFSARGVVDNYDRYPFPRRGHETLLTYDYRYRPESSRAYNIASLAQQYYLPLSGESAFGIGYTLVSDLDSGSPSYARTSFGGFGSFAGLHEQELLGRHAAVLSSELRLRLFSMPFGTGDEVYLSLRGNIGNVWNRSLVEIREKPRFLAGGGIGLSADTVFGELHLHYAVAAGGGIDADPLRHGLYIVLGAPDDLPAPGRLR